MGRSGLSAASADEVVRTVEDLLTGQEGRTQVERFNGLVADVVNGLGTLGEVRKLLRRRAETELYVSASDVRDVQDGSKVRLSVRVRGIECGSIGLGSAARVFRPTVRKGGLFKGCGGEKAAGHDWGKPAVAAYIKAALDVVNGTSAAIVTKAQGRPEADVESAFLRAIRTPTSSSAKWRGTQRPVCLQGLPLQVPVPISASKNPKIGDGHIDVLARLERGGKGLRVYELKAPEASGAAALHQAVAYVATLRFLLTQNAAAQDQWWKFIGFDHTPTRLPRFEAYAVVADTARNRRSVAAAREQLAGANASGIRLGAMFYEWSTAGRLGSIAIV